MEVLLDDIKQMVALLIKHLLAAGDGQHLAFDAQDGRAVGELDVEVVARQGHDFFLEHYRFRPAREELREDADGRRDLGEVRHAGGGWWVELVREA